MKVSSLDPKYVKMIEGVASDIVFKIEADAMRYAWSSLPIPTEQWELDVSIEIEVLVLDILADKFSKVANVVESNEHQEVKKFKKFWNWIRGKSNE